MATRAKRPPIARQLQIADFIGDGRADYSGRFLSHILSKLGMQSRTQAALYAARMGLVSGASRQEQPTVRVH